MSNQDVETVYSSVEVLQFNGEGMSEDGTPNMIEANELIDHGEEVEKIKSLKGEIGTVQNFVITILRGQGPYNFDRIYHTLKNLYMKEWNLQKESV